MSMTVYPPGGLELQSTSNDSGKGNGNGNWSGVLTASSIIDLTPALIERSLGSVTPLFIKGLTRATLTSTLHQHHAFPEQLPSTECL